jgi:ornithine cyclodeaminase
MTSAAARLPDDGGPAWISAAAVGRSLSMIDAIDALEQTLLAGLDPERDGQRSRLDTPDGQLLQMPSASDRYCGSKIISIRPANESDGVPVIQGVYVLFDGARLSPVAVLDGAALTALRTPAVSGLAVRHLATPGSSRIALFGTGVQAWGHVEAIRAVLDVAHVDVIGRTPANVEEMVRRIRATGTSAAAAGVEVVSAADVVVCTTAAHSPLFDGALVADHAVAVAIGSHSPDAREVDSTLVRRSSVVVESRTSALREAGDVVIPISDGAFDPEDLITLADLVRGVVTITHDRPRLFKGCGMPWQDLAVAGAIADRVLGGTG